MPQFDHHPRASRTASPACPLEAMEPRLLLAGIPPVAVDDAAQTDIGVNVAVQVLLNDYDTDDTIDPQSVTVVTGPTNGSAIADPPMGTITYYPGFVSPGIDTFTYTIQDAAGNVSNVATVTVRVGNFPPEAIDDSAVVVPMGTVTIPVLNNDTDPEGSLDPMTVQIVDVPAHGSAMAYSDGTISFTAFSVYTGPDSLTYTVRDAAGNLSNLATVNVQIVLNTPPAANNDSAGTQPMVPVTIPVLSNDTDAEGNLNPASLSITVQPANGSAVVEGEGNTISYTPDSTFLRGIDTFRYTVSDAAGAVSNEAVVTVQVGPPNTPPVAIPGPLTVNEDTPGIGRVTGYDPDGDNLTFVKTVDPRHGLLTFNSDGTYSYTPGLNWHGWLTFQFEAFDGLDYSPPMAVVLTVNSVNDAPTVSSGPLSASEDAPAAGSVSGSDVDGDTLSFVAVDAPLHGALDFRGDGTYTYTPAPDYFGGDSFTFKAFDGVAYSALGTTAITVSPVNVAPTALDRGEAIDEDSPLEGRVYGSDGDGDSLSFSLETPPAHGAIDFRGDGTFSYTPEANFNGQDSFTFTASDGLARSAPAQVTIDIAPVSDLPVAEGQAVRMAGQPFIDIFLVGSDASAPSSALTFQVASGPAHGSVSLTGNVARYTPDPAWGGLDTFTFTVTNPQEMVSSPAPVAIDVPLLFNAHRTAGFRNSGGRIVLSMAGPGYGLAYLSASGSTHIRQLDLLNTSLQTTAFAQSSATGQTAIVEGITVSGPLRGLTAPALDLTGPASFSGSLGTLRLNDVTGPATVNIQGTGLSSNLYFREVRDVSVTAAGKLGILSARRWLDGDETSDSIGAVSLDRLLVSGDAARRIPGDFEADLKLTGSSSGYDVVGLSRTAGRSSGGSSAPAVALGLAAIDGSLRDAVWQIAGTVRQILVGRPVRNWYATISGDVSLATFKAVQESQVQITGLLANLMADSFSASLLQAARIDQLLVRGDSVSTSLDATGAGAGRAALGLVRVLGSVRDSDWSVSGSAGTVRVGSADTWDFSVSGDLVDLLVGRVNDSSLTVDGMLRKGFSDAWDGGSIRAGLAGTIHVSGALRADVTINPLGLSVTGPVLNTLAVCGVVESSIINVLGEAGLIHFRSMLGTQVNMGGIYTTLGESTSPPPRPELTALVLGYPYKGQSVVDSTIRAGDIDSAYFVGRLSISGLTVEYTSIGYQEPGSVSGVNWVQV